MQKCNIVARNIQLFATESATAKLPRRWRQRASQTLFFCTWRFHFLRFSRLYLSISSFMTHAEFTIFTECQEFFLDLQLSLLRDTRLNPPTPNPSMYPFRKVCQSFPALRKTAVKPEKFCGVVWVVAKNNEKEIGKANVKSICSPNCQPLFLTYLTPSYNMKSSSKS